MEVTRFPGPAVIRLDEDVVDRYPTLGRAPKEHLIPFSVRLPLPMLEQLVKICDERKIDQSSLVRDFIAEGLRTVSGNR